MDNPPAVIESGDESKTGVDSRLREALSRVADDLAAKHTRMAIAVPVKQIITAVFEVIADLPRIPDYDSTLAAKQVWSSEVVYASDEVPDDPAECTVRVNGAAVAVRVIEDGADTEVLLNPQHAEGFFLAGLAAVAHLKMVGRSDVLPH
jgi:hypothetical protein